MKKYSTQFVLLTGAGFSKAFGGLLGSELRSHIANNLPYGKLKGFFVANPDYEDAIDKIINSEDFNESQKQQMREAFKGSYVALCEQMRNTHQNPNLFPEFIKPFLHFWGNQRPFFFTLNQDLFLEEKKKWWSPKSPKNIITPGVNCSDLVFKQLSDSIDETVEISDILDVVTDHAGPAYIKLHGSIGWYSSDGEQQLVMGPHKTQQINKEPLLRWYSEIFRRVMDLPERKILVIGYSFGDSHINEQLKNAIDCHGSEVHYINPSNIPSADAWGSNVISHIGSLEDIVLDSKRWLDLQRKVFIH